MPLQSESGFAKNALASENVKQEIIHGTPENHSPPVTILIFHRASHKHTLKFNKMAFNITTKYQNYTEKEIWK